MKKYLLIARTSLQNSLAYKGNFLGGSLFLAFIIYVFMQLWKAIYGGGQKLSGYTLNQIIWYFIITEIIYISGNNIFQDLNNDIKGGGIAYILNKPYHYLSYQLANGIGQIGVSFGINLCIGILLGLIYIGPLQGFTPINLLWLFIPVLLGLAINFFMQAAIGLTAFWMEENTAFFWIIQKLTFMLGLFIPVEFFPAWLQKAVLILPFAYITYGPAKLAVDFSWAGFAWIVSIQGAYLLVFILISLAVYAKGVRKLNVNGG